MLKTQTGRHTDEFIMVGRKSQFLYEVLVYARSLSKAQLSLFIP